MQTSSYKLTRHPSWKAATHKSRYKSLRFNARSMLTRRRNDPQTYEQTLKKPYVEKKWLFIKPRAIKVYEECCAFLCRILALYNKGKPDHLLTSLVLTDRQTDRQTHTHLPARFINEAWKSTAKCNTFCHGIFHNEPQSRYRFHSLYFAPNKVLVIEVQWYLG